MKNPQLSCGDGGRRLKGIHAPAGCLAADETHSLIFYKMVKGADCIAAASHAGNYRVRQSPFLFQNLIFDLFRNHRLKVPDNGGEGMGPHDGAQTVMGIGNPAGPLPHGLGDRILQGGGAGGHRHHLRSQQFHFVYIQGLALRVFFPHKYHALHTHKGRRRGGGYAVLTRPGLRDQPGLSHLLCQKSLSQHIVDFVGAGMV